MLYRYSVNQLEWIPPYRCFLSKKLLGLHLMYKYQIRYFFLALFFVLPAFCMVMFEYMPSGTNSFIAGVAIVFNTFLTTIICDFLTTAKGDIFFAYCGPDYAYSTTPTIVIAFVLPGMFFLYKIFSSREPKMKVEKDRK